MRPARQPPSVVLPQCVESERNLPKLHLRRAMNLGTTVAPRPPPESRRGLHEIEEERNGSEECREEAQSDPGRAGDVGGSGEAEEHRQKYSRRNGDEPEPEVARTIMSGRKVIRSLHHLDTAPQFF
mmetsp:Transcript_10765/g.19350  ORF Transcript_10765/g.19350 Transcript_10765/m.19350 type:complete len:126 (-) Transcript_10765:1406-1783(-)